MRLPLLGLAGLTLLLAAAGASAQTPAAPAAKPSVDKTTIREIIANPAAKAVVDKDLPGLTADPRLEKGMGMTLRDIEPYSEGKIDDAALTKVQQDFDALPPS